MRFSELTSQCGHHIDPPPSKGEVPLLDGAFLDAFLQTGTLPEPTALDTKISIDEDVHLGAASELAELLTTQGHVSVGEAGGEDDKFGDSMGASDSSEDDKDAPCELPLS